MPRRDRKKIRQRFFKKPLRVESITFQGNMATYHGLLGCQTPPQKREGSVNHEFSRSSRLRMLKSMATVDYKKCPNCLFMTLTYPDTHFDLTYQVRAQQRYLFWRKLEKFVDRKISAVWRTEWQRRKSGVLKGQKMPHVHYLVFGVDFIPWRDISDIWKGVIHAEGYVRVDVQRVRTAKGIGYYVAKYCAKVNPSDSLVIDLNLNNPGRAYGYQRQGLIPRCPKKVLLWPSEGQIRALRAIAEANNANADIRSGETFFIFSELMQGYEKLISEIP